jgi:hypothetical protein
MSVSTGEGTVRETEGGDRGGGRASESVRTGEGDRGGGEGGGGDESEGRRGEGGEDVCVCV